MVELVEMNQTYSPIFLALDQVFCQQVRFVQVTNVLNTQYSYVIQKLSILEVTTLNACQFCRDLVTKCMGSVLHHWCKANDSNSRYYNNDNNKSYK